MDKLTIAVYAGNMLKAENVEFITAKEVQKFIADDIDNGGHNLELKVVRMVLDTLVNAKFLEELGDMYTLATKNITHTTVIKNIVPLAEREEGFLNLINSLE